MEVYGLVIGHSIIGRKLPCQYNTLDLGTSDDGQLVPGTLPSKTYFSPGTKKAVSVIQVAIPGFKISNNCIQLTSFRSEYCLSVGPCNNKIVYLQQSMLFSG